MWWPCSMQMGAQPLTSCLKHFPLFGRTFRHWPPAASVGVWEAHTTVSATEVSLLLVLVCGMPYCHIYDRTWTINISRYHAKDICSGCRRSRRDYIYMLFIIIYSNLCVDYSSCCSSCVLDAYLLTYLLTYSKR